MKITNIEIILILLILVMALSFLFTIFFDNEPKPIREGYSPGWYSQSQINSVKESGRNEIRPQIEAAKEDGRNEIRLKLAEKDRTIKSYQDWGNRTVKESNEKTRMIMDLTSGKNAAEANLKIATANVNAANEATRLAKDSADAALADALQKKIDAQAAQARAETSKTQSDIDAATTAETARKIAQDLSDTKKTALDASVKAANDLQTLKDTSQKELDSAINKIKENNKIITAAKTEITGLQTELQSAAQLSDSQFNNSVENITHLSL